MSRTIKEVLEPEEIEIPVWYVVGDMRKLRDDLPSYHPQSNYNYIKNVLYLCPESYGYFDIDLPYDDELI